jgi:hypothetical protein
MALGVDQSLPRYRGRHSRGRGHYSRRRTAGSLECARALGLARIRVRPARVARAACRLRTRLAGPRRLAGGRPAASRGLPSGRGVRVPAPGLAGRRQPAGSIRVSDRPAGYSPDTIDAANTGSPRGSCSSRPLCRWDSFAVLPVIRGLPTRVLPRRIALSFPERRSRPRGRASGTSTQAGYSSSRAASPNEGSRVRRFGLQAVRRLAAAGGGEPANPRTSPFAASLGYPQLIDVERHRCVTQTQPRRYTAVT